MYIPAEYRLEGTRSRELANTATGKKKKFHYKQLFNLPWAFWMLPMTQVLQSQAAGAFGASATDLITMKGYEEDVAAFTANAKDSQSHLFSSSSACGAVRDLNVF